MIKFFKSLPKSVLSPYEREFSACQKAAGGDPLELIRTLPRNFFFFFFFSFSSSFSFFFFFFFFYYKTFDN